MKSMLQKPRTSAATLTVSLTLLSAYGSHDDQGSKAIAAATMPTVAASFEEQVVNVYN
jgi:hypothetical protein